MKGILSIGSINADFQMRVGRAPEGPGTMLAHDVLRASGGKAANVAVLARRLGAPARLLGCTGDDDLAEQALAGPRGAGVDVSFVRRAAGPTGLSTILVAPDGDKTIVLAPNANDRWPGDANALEHQVREMSRGSILVADLEVPVSVDGDALGAAPERGLTVVLDPSPTDRAADDLVAMSDHVTPDHREAQELTGIDAGSEEGALRAAEALRGRGAGAAYVKLATGGCAVVTGDAREVVRAPAVDVVDKTGAGDAFAGALAWALLAGREPVDAACVAVAAAACAVTAYGSQPAYPSPSGLEAMTARVVEANPSGRRQG